MTTQVHLGKGPVGKAGRWVRETNGVREAPERFPSGRLGGRQCLLLGVPSATLAVSFGVLSERGLVGLWSFVLTFRGQLLCFVWPERPPEIPRDGAVSNDGRPGGGQ